ncbi:MAG: NADH:ubiquinone oxidoreductase subunit N, partial [Gammaproteobacteria bacterium]|nr:NADH:ubiquinone oxidoreductase subunit N [Gammaproteobacteria bacterium]
MSETAISAVEFAAAAPEIALLILACVVLVVEVYLGGRFEDLTYKLGQASIIITAVLAIGMAPDSTQLAFSGTYIKDPMASLLKVFMLLVGYYAFFYMKTDLKQRGIYRGEYIIIGLFALLGMMVLVSAASLLTVYLGLELLSLSLYAMVAMDRDNVTATEAAMKYFVLGALASGMLLYGMSLVYGICGSLSLADIHAFVATEGMTSHTVLTLGIVLMLVGIAFKLGAAPFHMWVPDVYQGATTPVTLFIGTAPKIAAFGM